MPEYIVTQDQKKLLDTVPRDRLVLVQFIGCSKNLAINAPSPSGLLVDEFGLIGNYGLCRYGTLLYVLKEDMHNKYFQASKVKIELEDEPKAGGIFKAAVKKQPAKKGAVKVNRE